MKYNGFFHQAPMGKYVEGCNDFVRNIRTSGVQ